MISQGKSKKRDRVGLHLAFFRLIHIHIQDKGQGRKAIMIMVSHIFHIYLS